MPGSAGGRCPATASILQGDVASDPRGASSRPAGARRAVSAALATLERTPAARRVPCLLHSRGVAARRGGGARLGGSGADAGRAAYRERGSRRGVAGAPYEPGKLALREGPLLEAAVRALCEPPELLIVHAAGRDHPRGAGLALHLGAVLDLPSIGVTDRPLGPARAPPPADRGATSRLVVDGVEVARMLRTRAGARPVVVHAGWRTDLDTATWIALAATRDFRTPEPLRCARRLARHVRAAAESR
jgi:deoxyribonuclease V